PKPLFREVAQPYGIDFKHQENDFIDFKIQPLLPHKYSQNGPGIAVGDVDGNGLDDFYVGGASGQSGALYLQQVSPNKNAPAFTSRPIDPAPKPEEDMGSLLFDADSDGDLDLYVVSGGNEFAETSASYQDRLYLNDGKGLFSRSPDALPDTKASGSCVTATDFDHDGDLDLFVGGRVVPLKYPMPAQSYVLRNDSKNGEKPHFTDATASIAKELSNIGLVTSALWTDFDNDGWTDLVVVGEWMPLSFFKNQHGNLVNVTAATGLEHTRGWWNSLVAGDFDNDGDIDYVAGNLGLNSKYKASAAEPVCVYANDYDKNGSLDAILCYFLLGDDGKRYSYPAHPRDAMSDQMVSMRKIFPRYSIYATAKPNDFLPEKELKEAYVVQSENFSSSYIENLGKGHFRLKSLPVEAQIAPLFGMVSQDYNGDGQLDLFAVGNSYATETQMGQYDASIGLLLRGNGKGNFTPVKAGVSGFVVEGDAKGMAEITLDEGRSLLLVTKNSGKISAYQPTNQPKSPSIRLQPLDVYAVVTLSNGSKRRQEFYHGSTYLSQSGRVWQYPANAIQITVYDSRGKSRNIANEALSLQQVTAGKSGVK
ncbi:MAG: VCBS repeat-containing protein, partial [Bacteroidota bacterium]